MAQAGDFSSTTTVTGLPSTPSRNAMRQPQARRACVNPFNIDPDHITPGRRRQSKLLAGGSGPYRRLLISFSNAGFDDRPTCLKQLLPSREIRTVTGTPNIGPNASWRSSWSSPCSTV